MGEEGVTLVFDCFWSYESAMRGRGRGIPR